MMLFNIISDTSDPSGADRLYFTRVDRVQGPMWVNGMRYESAAKLSYIEAETLIGVLRETHSSNRKLKLIKAEN